MHILCRHEWLKNLYTRSAPCFKVFLHDTFTEKCCFSNGKGNDDKQQMDELTMSAHCFADVWICATEPRFGRSSFMNPKQAQNLSRVQTMGFGPSLETHLVPAPESALFCSTHWNKTLKINRFLIVKVPLFRHTTSWLIYSHLTVQHGVFMSLCQS